MTAAEIMTASKPTTTTDKKKFETIDYALESSKTFSLEIDDLKKGQGILDKAIVGMRKIQKPKPKK